MSNLSPTSVSMLKVGGMYKAISAISIWNHVDDEEHFPNDRIGCVESNEVFMIVSVRPLRNATFSSRGIALFQVLTRNTTGWCAVYDDCLAARIVEITKEMEQC